MYGQVPFHDEMVIALYNKIASHDLKFPDKPVVSETLKDLITKMLKKVPQERITLDEIKVSRKLNYSLRSSEVCTFYSNHSI